MKTDEVWKNDRSEEVYGSVSLHKLSKTMNTESTVPQQASAVLPCEKKSTREEFRGFGAATTSGVVRAVDDDSSKKEKKRKKKEGTEL